MVASNQNQRNTSLETEPRTRDGKLKVTWEARGEEAKRLASVLAGIQEALKVLQDDVTNVAANQTVGEYYCFTRGDWEKGLPFLALITDAKLLAVVKMELAENIDSNEAFALGDAWWDLAMTAGGEDRIAMQCRGNYWYRRALPDQTGLKLAKATKRLKDTADLRMPLWSSDSSESQSDDIDRPSLLSGIDPPDADVTEQPVTDLQNLLVSNEWLEMRYGAGPARGTRFTFQKDGTCRGVVKDAQGGSVASTYVRWSLLGDELKLIGVRGNHYRLNFDKESSSFSGVVKTRSGTWNALLKIDPNSN